MLGEKGVQVFSIYGGKKDKTDSSEAITDAIHMGGIIRLGEK